MRKKREKAKRVFGKMRLSSVLKTKERQKEIKLRKNFLPTLVVIFSLWLILTYLFFFVDPSREGSVPVFFVTLFFALLFTVSTLLANSRRGFFVSIATLLYLVLLYSGVGNLINLILIIAILIIAEVYFIKA